MLTLTSVVHETSQRAVSVEILGQRGVGIGYCCYSSFFLILHTCNPRLFPSTPSPSSVLTCSPLQLLAAYLLAACLLTCRMPVHVMDAFKSQSPVSEPFGPSPPNRAPYSTSPLSCPPRSPYNPLQTSSATASTPGRLNQRTHRQSMVMQMHEIYACMINSQLTVANQSVRLNANANASAMTMPKTRSRLKKWRRPSSKRRMQQRRGCRLSRDLSDSRSLQRWESAYRPSAPLVPDLMHQQWCILTRIQGP